MLLVYLGWLLPAALYHAILIGRDPTTSFRLFENKMLSPDPLVVILSYGVLVPVAYWSVKQKIQKKPLPTERWLILWALAVPFLLYAPVSFQRRLNEAWQLPIVILAVPVLAQWYDWLKTKLKSTTATYGSALAVLIFFISPWQTWISCLAFYHTDIGQNFYYPLADLQALRWLDQFDQKPGIILSSPYTGQAASFNISKKIFVGHSLETLRAEEKLQYLKNFLANNSGDAEKKEFLKQWGITYLFWGATEKNNGSFNPVGKSYLEKIYDQNQVAIYRIKL